jgi:hypothetical protein
MLVLILNIPGMGKMNSACISQRFFKPFACCALIVFVCFEQPIFVQVYCVSLGKQRRKGDEHR